MVTQKKPKLETIQKIKHPKKKRKGVHAKTKASKLKGSKNYLKKKVGQG